MDKHIILENLALIHPDVFLVLIIKYNKDLKSITKKHPTLFANWPNELFIATNFLGIENLPNKDTREINELQIKEITKFIFNNKTSINWEKFSLKGKFLWSEEIINSFEYDIYWGAKIDFLGIDYYKYYNYSNKKRLIINKELQDRLSLGGLSYNKNLLLNYNILKNHEGRWDYFALFNNIYIDWDFHSYLILRNRFLDKFEGKRFEIEQFNQNEFYFYASLIGSSVSKNINYRRLFSEKFETFPKFYITKKVLQSITNYIDLYEFLILIGDCKLEKYRLEGIYSYRPITYKSDYIINLSLDFLNDLLDNWFSDVTCFELSYYLDILNLDKVDEVKKILNNLKLVYEDIYFLKAYKESEEDEDYYKYICPACHESPCRCSDPW